MSQIKEPDFPHSEGRINIGSQPKFSGDEKLVFCFKHLHPDHTLTACAQHSEKRYIKGLMKRFEDLSALDWNDIQVLSKSQGGSEKIPRDALKCVPPESVSSHVKTFLSIRFANTLGRIIGYRGGGELFNIVYIDTSLSVYDHGG